MRRDAGISHRGTEYTEIEFQDSGRKKIKNNLCVPGVFVVQGFFTAKTRRALRVFLLVYANPSRKTKDQHRTKP